MWARVSSFMQDEQTNQTEHQTADCDSLVENSISQGNFQQADSEWRPRFSFSLGLGEILYNWGFLRRKPSQTDSNTDSPSKLGTNLSSSSNETIELHDLNSFTSNEVQNLTWKTATSMTPNSNVFSSPLQINKSNLLYDSDTLRAVSSVSSLFDSTSLNSFIWEEIEDLETGLGHEFVVLDTNFPMWCDRCGDLLWGLHGEYLRCQNCHYTCHPQCRDLVTLDCRGVQDDSDGNLSLSELASSSIEAAPISSHDAQDVQVPEVEKSLKGTASNTLEDLKLLIDEHNTALPYPGLEMTAADQQNTNMTLLASALLERGLTVADLPSNLFLGDWEEDGGNFRGFIRVHMNLCRPISVVAGTRPPSIYDILKEDQTIEKTLTSFYLPRDTVKALHITSTTTTSEVIVALLKKFKVVDNPRKFALYERYYEDGETAKVKMRRIADNETPLVLALRWSRESNCNKMFVLQENDTGDILWEAFTLPELNNFLRILDREEEEYKRIVRQKYQQLAAKIQEAMDRFSPPATTSAASSEVSAGMTENDQESSSLEVGVVAAEATEEQNAS